jgi:hypothetical protein
MPLSTARLQRIAQTGVDGLRGNDHIPGVLVDQPALPGAVSALVDLKYEVLEVDRFE